MQPVTFSFERRLFGRVFEPREARTGRRGVLFVHGMGSSQVAYEPRARTLTEKLDAVCLTFDLSGHGGDADRFDRYSVFDHIDDLTAAYDYLVSRSDVDGARVGVCGASYGAYLAALLTAQRTVKRLVLRAPALAIDIDPFAPSSVRAKPVPERFDSLAVLRRYGGEVLLVESEKDEVVPQSHIEKHLQALPQATREVIPEATHALTDERWNRTFVDLTVRWFANL
jgi:pimeloyl-ACP methyl ester carboxylesterase